MVPKEVLLFKVRIKNSHLSYLTAIKNNLQGTINEISSKLSNTTRTIFGLELALKQAVFPHKYGKRATYWHYDISEFEKASLELDDFSIRNISPKLFDNFDYRMQGELENQLRQNKYWKDKWENLLETFNKELDKIEREIKDITGENNKIKKQVIDYYTLKTVNIQNDQSPIPNIGEKQEANSNPTTPKASADSSNKIFCELKIQELNLPEDGDLIDKCGLIAKKIGLKKGITMFKGYGKFLSDAEFVFNILATFHHIKSTKGSVRTTLTKLKYCKRRN